MMSGPEMIKGQERKVGFPNLLYIKMLCTEQHLPPVSVHSWSLCLPALWCKMQCGMKRNPRNLITLHTYMYAKGTVLCIWVCVCCRVPWELQCFCTAAFTDSFSFSPAPHPPVWPSPPTNQSLIQRAMIPGQFPMGYDSYSVEQQQGVWLCLCGGGRCRCVISLTWQFKGHVVWSTLVHLTSG